MWFPGNADSVGCGVTMTRASYFWRPGASMKTAIYASIASVLIGTSAFAADMAVKAPPPAPALPPISWSGLYGGINVGGTWSDEPINVSTTNLFFCPTNFCGGGQATAAAFAQGTNGTFSGASAGFVGGGQFGYNWQLNSWVAGFEADIQGTGVKATGESNATVVSAASPSNFVTTNVSVAKEIDYLGTVRGRLGWLASPTMLVYGTGGLAYGGLKASTNVSATLTGFACPPAQLSVLCNPSTSAGLSETRTGWTAGGGFELDGRAAVVSKVRVSLL
jgi:outer membrane immunogenic protein